MDVTRTPAGGPKPGSNGKSAAQPSRGQGPQSNQPRPGENKKTRKDKLKAPKPVVRPEISDEEVSKQVKDTLARLTSKNAKSKGSKYRKEKREAVAERMNEEFQREEQERSILKVTEFVTVAELATMMNVSATEVITACMNLGLMVSINQRLDAEALVVVAEEFGFKTEFVSADIQEAIGDDEQDSEEDLVPRPPIVTVMGHVDHGKTSLLDNIRKTNVIEGEAGGITQHIGAYSVELNGQKITFLDTPGHEAFTAMRARGAKITDVAIIIVAADDNVMPQTVEAINHAQAAGVPMVFAINKIDKPAANPDHIKERTQMNYLVESWGGKYQDQEVSAKKGLNLDKLLEKVLLEAEMLDLKANPNRRASGAVIESTLDKGRGYVATVLVQNGTLHIGDVMLSGIHTGRVKAMFNENGQKVTEAGPSTPVQVLGLNGAPQAGDTFNVMEDDRSAREIANKREQLQRIQGIMTQKHVTLDEIGRRIAIGSFKELNIIVKGDVDGSVEAMSGSLIKLSKETVQVNVIHSAVGQISESDVLLAAASNAIIVGFQVRPVGIGTQVSPKGGDRNPPLFDHLRCDQRHQGCHRRHARTGDEGRDCLLGGSHGDLPNFQSRHRRRMRRPRKARYDPPHPDPRDPRRYRDLHGQTRSLKRFRTMSRGAHGPGLRSEHRILQRHPRRRCHRRLRASRGKTQLTECKRILSKIRKRNEHSD